MLLRQKVLIGLLLQAQRTPLRVELMKWSFLLTKEAGLPPTISLYDFVPYKYGPFSFALYHDLHNLSRLGYISPDYSSIVPSRIEEAREKYDTTVSGVKNAVQMVLDKYSTLSERELIDYVYATYPWYAGRSELTSTCTKQPIPCRAIYTIGYEGLSIDGFLDRLLRMGIRRVIDVRGNPFSRKYGFHKATLERLTGDLDIGYVHLPELGIPSHLRRDLQTYEDYQDLFSMYEKTVLPAVPDALAHAAQLMQDSPSTFVCFEADPAWCHRSRLGQAVGCTTGLEVVHL